MKDMGFVSFLLIQVLVAVVTGSCRDGWMKFHDSCYFFANVKESWIESQYFCSTFGAKLVEIESQEENNFIKTTLEGLHAHDPHKETNRYWTGGNDVEVEGVFLWSKSNQRFTFTDWGGPPSNTGGEEDCVELYGGNHFVWNDLPCETRIYFACEMLLTPNKEQIIG